MKKLNAIISLIVALLFTAHLYAQNRNPAITKSLTTQHAQYLLQNFYLNDTFTNYISIVNTLLTNTPDAERNQSLQIFTSIVIAENDYAQKISDNFNHFPRKVQTYFLAAMNSANLNDIAQQLESLYKIKNSYKFTYSANEIVSMKANSTKSFDNIWAAFYATGSDFALKKLLIYLKNRDDLVLKTAGQLNQLTIKCKKSKDSHTCFKTYRNKLMIQFKKHYDNNAKMKLKKAVETSSLLWSISTNINQEPGIALALQHIFEEDPSLDYQSRLKRLQ